MASEIEAYGTAAAESCQGCRRRQKRFILRRRPAYRTVPARAGERVGLSALYDDGTETVEQGFSDFADDHRRRRDSGTRHCSMSSCGMPRSTGIHRYDSDRALDATASLLLLSNSRRRKAPFTLNGISSPLEHRPTTRAVGHDGFELSPFKQTV